MNTDILVFTRIENETFVGTNVNKSGNAIKNGIEIPEKIIIPSHYNGTEITSIGQYAFTNCTQIKEVHIFAPIKIIHNFVPAHNPSMDILLPV